MSAAHLKVTTEYVQTRIGAGELPHLAGTGVSELLHDDAPEASFELGLDWLIELSPARPLPDCSHTRDQVEDLAAELRRVTPGHADLSWGSSA